MATLKPERVKAAVKATTHAVVGGGASILTHQYPCLGAGTTLIVSLLADKLGNFAEQVAANRQTSKNPRVFPTRTLSETLEDVVTSPQLAEVIRKMTFNKGSVAFFRMLVTSHNKVRRMLLYSLLFQVVIDSWECDGDVARRASAILTGLPAAKEAMILFKGQLHNLVALAIHRKDKTKIGAVESIAYLFSLDGDEEISRNLTLWLINDQPTRVLDALADITYVGGSECFVSERLAHFERRRGLARGHDIGRNLCLLIDRGPDYCKKGIGKSILTRLGDSASWDMSVRHGVESTLDKVEIALPPPRRNRPLLAVEK